MHHRLIASVAALVVVGILSGACSGTCPRPEDARTTGDTIRDATITASVKLALAFEPGVAATEINVDTSRGVVTLRGEVGTQAERQLAARVAEDVRSVTRVVNDLTIRG